MPKPTDSTVKVHRTYYIVVFAIAAVMMAIGLLLDQFGVVPFISFMLLIPIVGLVLVPVCVGIGCIYPMFFSTTGSYDTVYNRLGPMLTFLASVSIGCLGVGLFVFIFLFLLS